MVCLDETTISKLEKEFGEDFIFGVETSADLLGYYKGFNDYIDLFSDTVTEDKTVNFKGRTIHASPMPKENINLKDKHILDEESIFYLTIKRDEIVTGDSWETLTYICEVWGVHKSAEVIRKLPKELYDLSAQDFIEYLNSPQSWC